MIWQKFEAMIKRIAFFHTAMRWVIHQKWRTYSQASKYANLFAGLCLGSLILLVLGFGIVIGQINITYSWINQILLRLSGIGLAVVCFEVFLVSGVFANRAYAISLTLPYGKTYKLHADSKLAIRIDIWGKRHILRLKNNQIMDQFTRRGEHPIISDAYRCYTRQVIFS